MERERRITRNALVTFLSSVGNRGVSLVGSILFARFAGESALGSFFAFMSAYRLLSITTSLGIGQALIKRLSETPVGSEQRRDREILGAALLILSTITVGVVGLLFLVGPQFDAYIGVEGAVVAMALFLSIMVVYSTYRQTIAGSHRVGLASLTDTVRNTAVVVAQLGLILLGFDAAGLVGGVVAGSAFAAVAAFLLSPTNIPARPGREQIRSLVQFGKFSYLDSFFGTRDRWYDILVLKWFVADGPVGVYGVLNGLSQFGFTLSSSIGKTLYPEVSNIDEQSNLDPATLSPVFRYTTIISVPLLFGAVTVGDLILQTVYAFEYGTTTLVLLSVGSIAFSLYEPIHQILYGLDDPERAFKISSTTTGLNVALLLLLVPPYGILGAAVATATAMTASFLFGVRVLKQTLPSVEIFQWHHWSRQLASSLVMSVVVLFGREELTSGQSLPVTLGLVLLGAIVYGLTLVAIDETLRTWIRSTLDDIGDRNAKERG